MILFSVLCAQNTNHLQFEHFTTQTGLSQNAVYSILQDQKGFMWFGTRFGLNRYNGRDFKKFLHDPTDSESLPGYFITALCEDKDGFIWVGTNAEGVSRYNPRTEKFTNFRNDPGNPYSIHNNFISAIYEDDRGFIWVGTKEGVSKYSPDKNFFVEVSKEMEDNTGLAKEIVLSITETPDGTIWIGTEGSSLYKISRNENKVEKTLQISNGMESARIMSLLPDASENALWVGVWGQGLYQYEISSDMLTYHGVDVKNINYNSIVGVYSISQANDGSLWMGTVAGLTRYDPLTGSYQFNKADPGDLTSLAADLVYITFIDRQGILWVGTESQGVDKFDPTLKRFDTVIKTEQPSLGLRANMVFGISKAHDGNMWFSTIPGGTSTLDLETGKYTHYFSIDDKPKAWSKNYVNKACPVSTGEVWIATFQCGIYVLDPDKGNYQHYRKNPADPSTLLDNTTYAILETTTGEIWIGGEVSGLTHYNRNTDDFSHYFYDGDKIDYNNRNFIYTLLEDRDGFIWLGTNSGGLYRFDPQDKTFINYKVDPDAVASLTSNCVIALHEDKSGNLWIGTRSGGLNKIDPARQSVSTLDIGQEMLSSTVFGILEDESGYLWLSTNSGIRKVHKETGLVNVYKEKNGAQTEFYYSSAARDNSGFMYFGGTEGYNVFHPDSIINNTFQPNIVWSNLRINYESVQTGSPKDGRIILYQSIAATKSLDLNYKDRVIELDFALLNFSDSQNNQYAYKLEGLHQDWIYCDQKHTAQFMNLKSGEYVLQVKGANNDGYWSDNQATLAINISPPFWETGWFRFIIICLIGGILFAIVQLRLKKILGEEKRKTEKLKVKLKLDHQQRELVVKSIDLIEKQKFLEEMLKDLREISKEDLPERSIQMKRIIRKLTTLVSFNHAWEEFEKWFSAIHSGFISTLRKEFKELTEQEIRVCALLRLSLTSKEIASMMNVEPASVEIYRYRIRKKLDLSKGENLTGFLGKF